MGFLKPIRLFYTLVVISLFVVSPLEAPAGETDAFHTSQGEAYSHYRQAMFYARSGNIMTAAFELETMSEKWAKLVSQYSTNPPAVYTADTRWKDTLEAVAKHINLGLAAAIDGDGEQTRKQLKPISHLLADMRRRNDVVIFSDHVDAANVAFRRLFEFRRKPVDFDNPVLVQSLQSRLTATIAAYEKCLEEAPPSVAANEQFQRLMADSLFYLKRIERAIDEKNQLNVLNILRRVVSSDKLLWLLFG